MLDRLTPLALLLSTFKKNKKENKKTRRKPWRLPKLVVEDQDDK
jgi:hypothetical protein